MKVSSTRTRSFLLRIFCALIITTTIFLAATANGFCFSAQASDTNIVDIGAKWDFVTIGDLQHGDLFSDGKYKLVCVETQAKMWSLWNPVLETLSAPAEKECIIPQNVVSVDSSILREGNSNLNTDMSNGNEADEKVYNLYDPKIDSNCGSIFGDYYTITHGKSSREEFYVFGRLRDHLEFEKSPDCDFRIGKLETVSMGYDTIVPLDHADLGHGTFLFYSVLGDYYNPPTPIFAIKTVPNRIWHSNDNAIIIIPRKVLQPLLDNAGFDPAARYSALLRLITSLVAQK